MKNGNFFGIEDMLIKYAESSCIRFHMPGHGGAGQNGFLKDIYKFDVTENSGTDNLYSPNEGGAVKKTLEKLRNTFGSKASVISAHGATASIQAAVYSCVQLKGKRFFIDRCSHASVINAMALCGCEFEYFSSFDDLSNRLEANNNSTVIITSPNYYGKMKDIGKYSSLCHINGCLLVVDNSHGSHLWWHGENLHPLLNGADFSVDSFHKTLPVLTGGAVLHSAVCEEKMMLDGIKLFASTSPSYLIASSVDAALDFMNKEGPEHLSKLLNNISGFAEKIRESGIDREQFSICDPYRITLKSSKTSDGLVYDMNEFCSFLEERNIFPEFSDKERCVLIPSVFSKDDDFAYLTDAVYGFISSASKTKDDSPIFKYPICERKIPISDAVFCTKKSLPVKETENMISGEIKYVYPPGIPIITPGEIISGDIVKILIDNNIHEIDVIQHEKY